MILALSQEGGSQRRIADLSSFKAFASQYMRLLRDDASVPERKLAVQKFIQKVEVGVETVRIYFIIDKDHFTQDPAPKPGLKASGAPSLLRIMVQRD